MAKEAAMVLRVMLEGGGVQDQGHHFHIGHVGPLQAKKLDHMIEILIMMATGGCRPNSKVYALLLQAMAASSMLGEASKQLVGQGKG